MTTLDWIALGVVALMGLAGLRRGLIVSGLSVAGVVAGAILGARLAPQLLSGGTRSPYTPLVGLAGAVVLAMVLRSAAALAGSVVRGGLRLPPLRALDSAGGLVLGAAAGLALVWVLGAVALQLPGQTRLRQAVQRSHLLRRLNELLPPSRLLNALHRVDPFPAITGPAAPLARPNPELLREPAVRRAAPSVVRVIGTACGLGVEGSGWVAGRGLVVTAAHVVAGERDTSVQLLGSGKRLPARAVAFDPRNDVAVLRVPALLVWPLPLADPRPGTPVVILGYPENGPLQATPGRIGETATVLSGDAYGRGPVARAITSLRGLVRQGNSGGPAVDAQGRVQTTVFAARIGSQAGYGVPAELVRRALAGAGERVSTGPCVAG